MKNLYILLILILNLGCKSSNETTEMKFTEEIVPSDTPIVFKENLTPTDKLIHKGIFSPDLGQYYYTISDKNFKHFNVYVIEKQKHGWSKAKKAFFNSDYNDHGMSFSPDGNSIYFSSNRPTGIDSIPETWHIWRTNRIDQKWEEPTFLDIPNLKYKLVSHPTITDSGALYFHSSNLDYSEMDIYYSKSKNGKFGDAIKSCFPTTTNVGKCTPYISPKEDYILFAAIGKKLDLMISFNDELGNWTKPRKLSKHINESGQGNPYVTPDHKFLFFTTGNSQENEWKVKWVNIESEIESN